MSTMDFGILSGIVTAAMLAAFLAVCAWAYGSRRRDAFDEAARLPLEHDEDRP